MTTYIILMVLLGGISSAAHGGDWLTKGAVITLNAALAVGIAAWFSCAPVGAALGCAIYWLCVRVGKNRYTPFNMAGITLDYQGHDKGFAKLAAALGFWACVCASLLTYTMPLRVEFGVFIAAILFTLTLITAMTFQNHDPAGKFMLKHGRGIIDNRRVFEFISGCAFNGSLMIAGGAVQL